MKLVIRMDAIIKLKNKFYYFSKTLMYNVRIVASWLEKKFYLENGL